MPGVRCCYQCPDRYIGCHSKCEEYIAKKKQWEEDKKKIKAQMENIGPTSKYAYDINFMYGRGKRKR